MSEHPMDSLRTALFALTPAGDADRRLYRIVLDWALDLTGAGEGGVLSVSEDAKSMRIEEYSGKGVGVKSRILPLTDPPRSICARAALSRQPQNVPDVCRDPCFHSVSDSPIRSLLAVPVVVQGTVRGVLNLESTRVGHFTGAHLDALRDFSGEVAPFWSFVEAAVRGYRRKELLGSLLNISASQLADPPDPRATLDMILAEALHLTRSDLGGVCLLSFDRDALIVGPATGLAPGVGEAPRIPKSHGFTWRSVVTGTPQNVPNVAEHPDVFHDLSGGGVQSLLCAPMFIGGEAVGVLNMESRELNHFSLLDAEILSAFAYQAGIRPVKCILRAGGGAG